MSDVWTLTRRDAVALVTFTRPPRNFLGFAELEELAALLRPLGDRDDVSVVVLTGGLEGYFVAHADLEDLARLGRGEPAGGDPRAWYRTLTLLEALPQPVVAAINGQCWGGGCELALACTLRIGARSATLALPEVGTAIIPGAGGTQRLPRLVGTGRALDLILTGRVVSAEEALGMGLLTGVLDDDGFADAALDWAVRLAERPRPALVAVKRAVLDGTRMPFSDGLRLEGQLVGELLRAPATMPVVDALRRRYDNTPADVRVEF